MADVPAHVRDYFKRFGKFGAEGGKTAAERMTPEQLTERAKKAAAASAAVRAKKAKAKKKGK
jgi:hypothetical protein